MEMDWLKHIRDPNPWTVPRPLPGPVVTERLEVRLYQRGDGPQIFEAINSEREAMLPFMVWALTEHRCVEDSIYFVESCRRKLQQGGAGDFFMGVFERDSGRYVGGSGFARIQPELREAEIGCAPGYHDTLGFGVLVDEWDCKSHSLRA